MIKVKATCGIGFCGAYHEEEFEFDDSCTEKEMEDEIYEWAEQFLDVNWEIIDEDDEEASY